jgi:hypothetical protein
MQLLYEGNDADIPIECGFSTAYAKRLRAKALRKMPDGSRAGQRALVPWFRMKEYRRKVGPQFKRPGQHGGDSGLLQRFFREHRDIQKVIDDLWIGRKRRNRPKESRRSVKAILKRLIELCDAKGVEFALRSRDHGRESLRRYLHSLDIGDFRRAAKEEGGAEAHRRAGRACDPITHVVAALYTTIEIDEYTVDARFIFSIVPPSEMPIDMVLERFKIIAARETGSMACLGYHIVWRTEVNAIDVIQLLHKIIKPWTPMTLTTPGLKYQQGAGFPNGWVEGLDWTIPARISLDGALAHLAGDVQAFIGQSPLSISLVNYEPGAPNQRWGIEQMFLTLAREIQRLPNTTGAFPGDPRGKHAEEEALKYQMTLDLCVELVEVIMTGINVEPIKTLEYRTPLQYIRWLLTQGVPMLRHLEPHLRPVFLIPVLQREVTVHARTERGERPYVNFHYCTYSSALLKNATNLIGKKILIRVDPLRARTVQAFTLDGVFLCVLYVEGAWGRFEHTLFERTVANQLRDRKNAHYLNNPDTIHGVMDGLAADALVKNGHYKRKPGLELMPHAINDLAEICMTRKSIYMMSAQLGRVFDELDALPGDEQPRTRPPVKSAAMARTVRPHSHSLEDFWKTVSH